MTSLTEADVGQAALDWPRELGWQVAHGQDITPDTSDAERTNYDLAILERRLRAAPLPQLVPEEVTVALWQ